MDDALAFVKRERVLLENERNAEIVESSFLLSSCSPKALDLAGLSISNLTPLSVAVFFGGKDIVELGLHNAFSTSPTLPSHTFRPGDLARITLHAANIAKTSSKKPENTVDIECVVYKVTDTKIVVTINSSDNNDSRSAEADIPERCRLLKVVNVGTFNRLDRTIDTLERKIDNSKLSPLESILLGLSPLPRLTENAPAIDYLDPNLNFSQKRAVDFALNPESLVALIHGPPGTGKTSTLVEIIRQFAKQGKSILICGASNLAVDNLLERLRKHDDIPRVTRLGHPARVLQDLHTSTLDYQVARSDNSVLIKDIKDEIQQHIDELRKGKIRGKDRRDKWDEVKALRKDLRKREGGIVQSVVEKFNIILATCHGAGGRQIEKLGFDVVVIDEAAQALEASCWIPIIKGKKLILAGDHLQLPPTVKSEDNHTKSSASNMKKKKTVSTKSSSAKKKTPKSKETSEHPPAPGEVVDANSTISSSMGDNDANVDQYLHLDDETEKLEKAFEDDEQVDSIKQGVDDMDVSAKGEKAMKSKGNPKRRLKPPKSLSITLFDRLLFLYGSSIKRTLRVQYRMNAAIMEFPSKALYGNKLIAHESVAQSKLSEIVDRESGTAWKRIKDAGLDEEDLVNELDEPVVFYDTAGASMYETTGEPDNDVLTHNDSKSNANEAAIVGSHVKSLIDAGVKPSQISIISPYNAQVSLINGLLRISYPEIEIGSVDGFQGREKDVIVLSLVRSNEDHEVGFLAEKRRLNVAMTRAKRQLVVIGDSTTISQGGNYLKMWMDWLEENADVRVTDTLE